MKTKTIFITLIAMLAVTALIFQSCKKDDDKPNQHPTCKITAPTDSLFLIGDTVKISVEASDNVEVIFAIDGEDKDTVSTSPYDYEWYTITYSLGDYTITATSIDTVTKQLQQDSMSIKLIDNTPPNALFTVSPSSGTTSTIFVFDASGSTDHQDTITLLQVRWDIDGNGIWDTDWDFEKTIRLQYSNEITYTAILEVKDTKGLTGTDTTSIIISYSGSGEPCPGTPTVTDEDGNIYPTVQIGGQCWMKENLRVGTRIDGEFNQISNDTIEKYCYDDDSTNCETYGGLYQWGEMMQYDTTEGTRGICPEGWHLPTDDEWKILEMKLGMSESEADTTGWRGTDQGEQLKSTSGWIRNSNGTNSSGFEASPGGRRQYSNGAFGSLGYYGYWWSSTVDSTSTHAKYRNLGNHYIQVGRDDHHNANGFSVRCLMD